ncbi:MAG: PEP-CTERM sorting domain-containing protein [Desulfobacteraceae bacterium]|nr:PEP-CTERM sorting domain-containing protein [Desulfobacteraceae bacterium]
MRKGFLCSILVGVFVILCSMNAYAVTMYIGDVDGFGYGGAVGYNGAYGGPADINGNGLLDSGDALPDLNGDSILATGRGDDFDHRSAQEMGDTDGSQWTDVSLSTSYNGRPGLAKNASFTFYFTIDPNDPYYGQDHFLNLVYGDYDVKPMRAVVEGEDVDLLGNQDAGYDGYIWRAYVQVEWEDMLDGVVTIDIVAPREPYVAFDYALLDTKAIPVVPEPTAILLLGSGLLGLAVIGRKYKK